MSDQHDPEAMVSLHGTAPPLGSPEQRLKALEQAFDYRGDVTIQTDDGRVLVGYVYNHLRDGPRLHVRLMLADGDERVTIPCDSIVGVQFTGRDTAEGKSWQTWVKNYEQKKARGEKASLEPDELS